MNKFVDGLKEETTWTKTTNGMDCRDTTGDKLLDLFSQIGAMRTLDDDYIQKTFMKAFSEDKLLATKMAFYARDVRNGGLGERRTPRVIFGWMARMYPDILRKNIQYIPMFGRWDDLYCLVDTPVEADMWNLIKRQFYIDLKNMSENKQISIMAKWLKSVNTSSKESVMLGRKTAKAVGLQYIQYQKLLAKMRAYINVIEAKMSANEWNTISYEQVPSMAMTKYRSSFGRHDFDRFSEYINEVKSGTKKINASTLFPYDLTSKYIDNGYSYRGGKYVFGVNALDDVVEQQWKALPNYIDGENNVLVVADTSGSMRGQPIATAIGLAIYFAERNSGAFKNLFVNFSSNPKFVEICGDTLKEKLESSVNAEWGNSTDIFKVFELVLSTCINNNLKKEDVPKALVIISDMQFNSACNMRVDLITHMKKVFASYGYDLPNIIFWNANSYGDMFHAKAEVDGIQMFSGNSASTFKNVLKSIGFNAYQAMVETLSNSVYDCITI